MRKLALLFWDAGKDRVVNPDDGLIAFARGGLQTGPVNDRNLTPNVPDKARLPQHAGGDIHRHAPDAKREEFLGERKGIPVWEPLSPSRSACPRRAVMKSP